MLGTVAMKKGFALKPLALAFTLAFASLVPSGAENVANASNIVAQAGETRVVTLGIGKSLIIELPRDTSDILVSSPAVADAVIRSPRRVYVTGISTGETDIFFFDAAGRQILGLDLMVGPDTSALNRIMSRHVRGNNLKAETVNSKLVITGSVNSPADARRVNDIAAPFAGGEENIINLVTIEGEDQVHVKVTVAEVRRETVRQLGAVADIALDVMRNVTLGATIGTNFIVNNGPVGDTGIAGRWDRGNDRGLAGTLRFMEETSALLVLAEPTLTAVSGEEANFLAGGEFPVPTGRTESGQITLEYKQFGVALNMVPIVHSEGRITLKLGTEVSEVSSENSFSLAGGGPGAPAFVIPSILTRRTNTTVELPSGGSIVLAGLIRDETRQGVSGVPVAKDIPILGSLFRSTDFMSSQTELVIIVTPYIVRAVDQRQLARPTDNFTPASGVNSIFLGSMNQIYGVSGSAPSSTYHGHAGFMID